MQNADGKPVEIYERDLASFWIQALPTPQQQVDSLILWIGDNQVSPEQFAQAKTAAIAAWLGVSVPRPDNPSEAGLWWLDQQLTDKGLYDRQILADAWAFKLKMAGWDRYTELKKVRSESRTAFMAMKFGDPILNNAVLTCFKPAVTRAGFELRTLTDRQPEA